MNEQLLTLIKSGLISAGTAIAVKFGLDQSYVPAIVGALITLGTSGWAIYAKRRQGIINSAAKVATSIVVPAELATNAPANVNSEVTHAVVTK